MSSGAVVLNSIAAFTTLRASENGNRIVPAMTSGPNGCKPVLELRHHTEVSAAAAHGPVEVGVLVRVGVQKLAVGGDDVDREQVVAGVAEFASETAHATAERETGDAGVRGGAEGGRELECLALAIELAEPHARLRLRREARWVDANALHRRQIDDEAAVADRLAGDAVAATAHGGEHAGGCERS